VSHLDRRLRQLATAAQRPPPVVGLERPRPDQLEPLRATATEALAATTALALLDAARRECAPLLAELSDHGGRADLHAHEALRPTPNGLDPQALGALAMALADAASAANNAAAAWCRSGHCEPGVPGLTGALRDAIRALARAVEAFPNERVAVHVAGVEQHVSEGRRLARRARAAAIDHGDLAEAVGRMTAIAAVERALSAGDRAASALRRLSLK
jgi:hypothetical protein